MTPAQVQELLELRRHATGEQFDAQGNKRDAWHDVLQDYDAATVMRRYRELVRAGTEKISLPTLLGGLQRTDTTAKDLPRTQHPDDCEHLERFDITPTHSRCNRCRADLYSANDPRIASQWNRWVEEGRAQARADRTARGDAA